MSAIVDVIAREILDSRGNPTDRGGRRARVRRIRAARPCRRARRPARRRRSSCATAIRSATSARACMQRGRERQHRDLRGDPRPRCVRAGADRQDADRARRHRQQVAARRERDPRRVLRGREGRGRGIVAAAVPLPRRRGRNAAAGAADERHQRRRARQQQDRPAGVHARAARRADVPRGAALRRRGVPHAEEDHRRDAACRRRSATRAASRRTCRAQRGGARSCCCEAIDKAGYTPGTDIALALDCAASEYYKDGAYRLEGERRDATRSQQMVDVLATLVRQVPDRQRSRTAWPSTTGTAGSS